MLRLRFKYGGKSQQTILVTYTPIIRKNFCLTFSSKTCHLEYVQTDRKLEDTFDRMTVLAEDEDVTKTQVAEDMSLYGTRPEPPDMIEVDEFTQLSNLPPKRSATDFDAAVRRPAKARKKDESKYFQHQGVPAMDWNSGASPLDAWLNQSALPFILPQSQTQSFQSGSSNDNLAAEELEDLKVFRRVYMEGIEEPKNFGTSQNSLFDLASLDPRAQIYLRNILDRYPLLPSYLALRLAEANCARASRLDLARENLEDQHTSRLVHDSGPDRDLQNEARTPMDDVAEHQMSLSNLTPDIRPFCPPPNINPRLHTCNTWTRDFARLEHLKRHEREHSKEYLFACEQCECYFSQKYLLLSHQLEHHTTAPSSINGLRYHVILSAPTAMIRQADEVPVTYLNKGQIYEMRFYDGANVPSRSSNYRIVVRISFDDEQQRQCPSAQWQLWKEGRGLSEAHQRGGKLHALEFVGTNSPSVKLETGSFDCFSLV